MKRLLYTVLVLGVLMGFSSSAQAQGFYIGFGGPVYGGSCYGPGYGGGYYGGGGYYAGGVYYGGGY
jgi:hypothetical protein